MNEEYQTKLQQRIFNETSNISLEHLNTGQDYSSLYFMDDGEMAMEMFNDEEDEYSETDGGSDDEDFFDVDDEDGVPRRRRLGVGSSVSMKARMKLIEFTARDGFVMRKRIRCAARCHRPGHRSHSLLLCFSRSVVCSVPCVCVSVCVQPGGPDRPTVHQDALGHRQPRPAAVLGQANPPLRRSTHRRVQRAAGALDPRARHDA